MHTDIAPATPPVEWPFPDIERRANLANEAFELELLHGKQDAEDVLRTAIRDEFPGRIALVSSFGADSAVLLHMVSRIDPSLPVVFVDSGKMFGETLAYRDRLIEQLGLTDVRTVQPDAVQVAEADGNGFLFRDDPDQCCNIRKVQPLRAGLNGFDAWISGRKGYQTASRALLPAFESDGLRVKVNPLAGWTRAAVDRYMDAHDLPRHPLVADGFVSIGCYTCTDRVAPGEDARAGRWRGADKTECGIHNWGMQ